MWHEARKQERMIRGLIVDYRRRAERRKDFYEKIKADPTQFLQLHGRPCKIHLDPAIAAAGESPAIMMPWQGNPDNLIDRFDVRAHLDYIPDVKNSKIPPEELSQEERQCNYERYRILAQNAFLDIGEDKFLQQLSIEEKFGVTVEEREAQKEKNEKKGTGVAIGYNYDDPGAKPSCSIGPETKPKVDEKESDDDSDFEIIDVDLSIDVNKMEPTQAHELNQVGRQFGMTGCDLFSFLTGDADDAEVQKQMLREEKEKAMYSGRKSRRERRAHRDKKLAARVLSPPSYAAPMNEVPREESKSPSRSPSPEQSGGKIQFITSFGGEDEVSPPKPLYADKLKINLKQQLSYSDVLRKNKQRSPTPEKTRSYGPHRPKSLSRSSSASRSRSKSLERRRSRSRLSPNRSRSRSPSRSSSSSTSSRSRRRRYRSRSRSRSRSRNRYYRRSRSRSRSRTNHHYSKRYDTDTKECRENQSKPALPRYYGRKKDDNKSSSEVSLDSDSSDEETVAPNKTTAGGKPTDNQNRLRLTGSSSKGPSRETMSLKERLKKKMQAQLSRQLRADMRAEAERMERESRRQARRDEEMRELAIKLRRKQRELRHQQNRRSSEESGPTKSRSRSNSSSRSSTAQEKTRQGSQSRSPSPKEKPIPVWTTRTTEPSDRRYRNYGEGPSADNYTRRRYEENEYKGENYQGGKGYDKYERIDRGWEAQQDERKYYRNSGSKRQDERIWPPGDEERDHDSNRPYSKKVKLVDY